MDTGKDIKLVKLLAVKSEVEAELIKHMLERKNIPCNVLNINNSRLLPELTPNICGVELWVPSRYVIKANQVIKESQKK